MSTKLHRVLNALSSALVSAGDAEKAELVQATADWRDTYQRSWNGASTLTRELLERCLEADLMVQLEGEIR